MNSCRFEFFPQLNGFRAKIPFLGGILIVSNMEYLENSQNIYSFPICSKYHILYFFFDAPQEIIFLEDNPAHAIHIPSDSVLAIAKGIAHQFVFSPRKRPRILNIYYQFTYNSVLSSELETPAKHERQLLERFFKYSYSIVPLHKRLLQELAITNEYLRTATQGDVLKLYNQFSNIFLSVFQQGSFESGPDIEALEKENIRRNTHYCLTRYLQTQMENANLESMAASLHYTPRHIQRLISECYGDRFSNVAKGFRISYAMGLLYDTDYSLGKICEMAGFSSGKAMFQAFKTALGMSPSQFRNLHRKKK